MAEAGRAEAHPPPGQGTWRWVQSVRVSGRRAEPRLSRGGEGGGIPERRRRCLSRYVVTSTHRAALLCPVSLSSGAFDRVLIREKG